MCVCVCPPCVSRTCQRQQHAGRIISEADQAPAQAQALRHPTSVPHARWQSKLHTGPVRGRGDRPGPKAREEVPRKGTRRRRGEGASKAGGEDTERGRSRYAQAEAQRSEAAPAQLAGEALPAVLVAPDHCQAPACQCAYRFLPLSWFSPPVALLPPSHPPLLASFLGTSSQPIHPCLSLVPRAGVPQRLLSCRSWLAPGRHSLSSGLAPDLPSLLILPACCERWPVLMHASPPPVPHHERVSGGAGPQEACEVRQQRGPQRRRQYGRRGAAVQQHGQGRAALRSQCTTTTTTRTRALPTVLHASPAGALLWRPAATPAMTRAAAQAPLPLGPSPVRSPWRGRRWWCRSYRNLHLRPPCQQTATQPTRRRRRKRRKGRRRRRAAA